MSNDKDYKGFTQSLCEALHELAQEAIEQKNDIAGKSTSDIDFNTGYLAGFHRVITLIQQHAEIYDINLEELSLSDLKDVDLI